VNVHAEALARLELATGEIDSLGLYLDEVARWNARVNLTAARTPQARVAQLVAPVVGARPFLRGEHLLDVGSGNGSPGLVLALLAPFRKVTLLEPRTRRWAFLRDAARTLGVQIDARQFRHDAYAGPPADIVTVRAVALTPAELDPLVRSDGRVLVWRPAETVPPDWRLVGRWPAGTAMERST
jgi:16S rRNA (guanine527-N7)-methyltransferase